MERGGKREGGAARPGGARAGTWHPARTLHPREGIKTPWRGFYEVGISGKGRIRPDSRQAVPIRPRPAGRREGKAGRLAGLTRGNRAGGPNDER